MFKRIPHESQDISGELRTEEYVKHHQKYARLQFKPFISERGERSLLKEKMNRKWNHRVSDR
ncbi:MAG: hypothetical protein JW882_18500 [Deltaproteobacteria bacterium]|nr:hypothetical protein [Deltaproteobacteria bacterium]